MEKGLLNGIILLDLREAFDLVDTDILLKKLSVYQCDENAIAWLKSYLQTREQCVQFKGKISDTKPVTHGVPQGSILDPLLFMNDLPLHVDLSLDIYADASTLDASGKTTEDLKAKLNRDMAKVNKWCKYNRMAIDCDKTKVMLITTYQKESKLDSTHIGVTCDNTQLENMNSNKLFGVIIDKNFSWKFHIDKIAKSICRNIALLRRIRKFLPHQTPITFYKSYIQPHINYCNTISGQSPHVNKIHMYSSKNGTETHHECSQSYTFCPTFSSMWG